MVVERLCSTCVLPDICTNTCALNSTVQKDPYLINMKPCRFLQSLEPENDGLVKLSEAVKALISSLYSLSSTFLCSTIPGSS